MTTRRRVGWGRSAPAIDIPIGVALAAAGIGMMLTGQVPLRWGDALQGLAAQGIGLLLLAAGVLIIRGGVLHLLAAREAGAPDDIHHPPPSDEPPE
jgi:hypothetical protein